MKSPLRISLKAGERLFVNGDVLRANRKVTLEFLNDISFMLEQHVLQEEEAATPLRQLYFIVQMILISPEGKEYSLSLFRKSISMLLNCFCNEELILVLKRIEILVISGRCFEALKEIRTLYPIENQIFGKKEIPSLAIESIRQEIP